MSWKKYVSIVKKCNFFPSASATQNDLFALAHFWFFSILTKENTVIQNKVLRRASSWCDPVLDHEGLLF